MGCCGGAKNKTKNQAFARSLTASVEIAAEGFAEVEYVGSRSSGERFSVYGYKTGTMYRVTPGKTFSVDSQDLLGGSSKNPGILEMMEVNKLMFKLVEQVQAKVAVKQVVQQVPQAESYLTLDVIEEETEEPVVADFSFLDGNLSSLDYVLQNSSHTVEQLEEMIAYEMANQNRKGAFTRLEEAIEALK